jgi:hypothetical protein
MDKAQKQLMRKIRRHRKRKFGGFRDDEELLHDSDAAEHESHSSEMLRLQGLIGNQAVQRLMNDSGSPTEDEGQETGNSKKKKQLSDPEKAALEKAQSEQAASAKAKSPYPFLPDIQKSVSRILSADPIKQNIENAPKIDEEKGAATQDKTQEEMQGGDFTDGKDPGKDIEERTIISAANTKVSLEGLLKGVYKQLPDDTMKEFQDVHDTIRTSSGYIAHKTREKAREAFENVKIVVDTLKDKNKAPVVDPLQNAVTESKGMHDSVLKAAIKARMAITDILANKPDVAEEAVEDKADEQEKEIQAASAADDNNKSNILPNVGEIKAQGFVMSHDEMLNEYITVGKDVRGSNAKSGIYAEQLVVQDLLNAPRDQTVIILAAHEPVQSRREAIIDLAFKRQDLKVYVCFVHGALAATGNRMIDATGGGWRDVINFR